MDTITTKCINGEIQAGDIVVSTPNYSYICLIGRVLKINLAGTPEHDETENETDDVHVNFMEFEYSKKRIKEIEDDFRDLYNHGPYLEDCGLDDVIMPPHSLIRIDGESRVNHLLKSGYNAACYCYAILNGLITEPEITLVTDEMEITDRTNSGFGIIRVVNGTTVKIELTDTELNSAFYYQENKFHTGDIIDTLIRMEKEGELYGHAAADIRSDGDLMGEIILKYEKNKDEYGMVWYEAAEEAIRDNIKNKEKGDE